jgi:UDP-N-acetylglucosamine/UDP-N-acetylgalactosamine diphosphorylase
MTRRAETQDARQDLLNKLQEKGVHIPCPESVEIGPDISLDRISGNGVIIHAGCKIYGPKTLIMDRVELGYEAPVTIHNCQLGQGVDLKGGGFYESTFLDKASMGSGAHVRDGCLLEEGAHGAHSVGLKHTILFPFVTLGSLINFCDCLMAGGTDDKNHSEVGSSYIHFNYTPEQDKATPSLMGDAPRGVMLNQPPIFLGGQGGLVGPVMLEYGTVVAAGTIVRKDLLKKDVILLGHSSVSKTMPFHPGLYPNLKRIITLNTIYISNLIALRRWYLDVRSRFLGQDLLGVALHEGAVEKLDTAIGERLQRLGEVAERMPRSIELYKETTKGRLSETTVLKKQEFFDRWQEMEQVLREGLDRSGDPSKRDRFLEIIEKVIRGGGSNYVSIITGLKKEESDIGISWLQGLVEEISTQTWASVPSLGIRYFERR